MLLKMTCKTAFRGISALRLNKVNFVATETIHATLPYLFSRRWCLLSQIIYIYFMYREIQITKRHNN